MEFLIPLGIIAVLGLVVAGMYNSLVRARQHVRESWSDVDTELQRRHNLIPNLVNTVKGYTTHEKELLENIVSLREKAVQLRPGEASDEQSHIESQLTSALGSLSVRVENYPTLKASSNFQTLQAELANTEDRVQAANRYYNGNVRQLNVKCESFPTNIIAGMFSFTKASYFKLADEAMREAPVVSF